LKDLLDGNRPLAESNVFARATVVVTGVAEGDARAYSRFAEADANLHRLIATGSGNRLIADTVERMHAHLHIFRALYRTDAPKATANEHRAIIDALVAHDPVAAERAVRVHLERSQQRMDRVLRQNEKAVEQGV